MVVTVLQKGIVATTISWTKLSSSGMTTELMLLLFVCHHLHRMLHAQQCTGTGTAAVTSVHTRAIRAARAGARVDVDRNALQRTLLPPAPLIICSLTLAVVAAALSPRGDDRRLVLRRRRRRH